MMRVAVCDENIYPQNAKISTLSATASISLVNNMKVLYSNNSTQIFHIKYGIILNRNPHTNHIKR